MNLAGSLEPEMPVREPAESILRHSRPAPVLLPFRIEARQDGTQDRSLPGETLDDSAFATIDPIPGAARPDSQRLQPNSDARRVDVGL